MKSCNHLSRVAELPCVVCATHPVHVHHVRNHAVSCAGKRASDWYTFPLCSDCHRSIHDGVKTWEMRHGGQLTHVAATLEKLYG